MGLLLSLIWRPAASPVHIVAGAAVLAVLAGVAYARTFRQQPALSTGLLAMRLIVIAGLTLLLMGPSMVPEPLHAPGRPRLSILLDTSGSMQTRDCQDASRLEYAVSHWLSPAQRQKLAESYDTRLIGFDARGRTLSEAMLLRPAGELGTGRSSRIIDCVTESILEVSNDSQDAAMVVLSDGHDSDDLPAQPAALLAKARNVPIYAVCLGGASMARDVALVALPTQEYLLAKEPGTILVKVFQVGLDEATTTLRLRCGQEETTQPVQFNGQRVVTIPLPVKQEQAGLYEYVVSVDPVAGETEKGNNSQSVFYEVTGQRIRVLLLEGEPFWDTKFLAQSLRKDARIELTQITQLSQAKQESLATRTDTAPSARLPQSAEELNGYDVLILGRGIEQMINRDFAQWLPDFVARRGGHIIFARGQAYDPETALGRQMGRDLAVLEPVIWGRGLMHNLSLSLTPTGRSSPCFSFAGMAGDVAEVVSRLPGFTVMPVIAGEKAATIVLARVSPRGQTAAADVQGPPGLVTMDYGRGKVVAILGEGMWGWSFLPPDLKAYDGAYDAFWSNMVRWLALGGEFQPNQDVSLKLGRSSVRLGDPLQLDVVCKVPPSEGTEMKVTLTDPAGKSQEAPLHRLPGVDSRLQGTFMGETVGVYRAVLESPALNPPRQEKKFSIYDVDIERLQTSANPEAMRTLAEQSGGILLRTDQAGQLPAELARQRQMRIVAAQPDFVWDKWLILVVLLVWTGAEWLARRRAGWL